MIGALLLLVVTSTAAGRVEREDRGAVVGVWMPADVYEELDEAERIMPGIEAELVQLRISREESAAEAAAQLKVATAERDRAAVFLRGWQQERIQRELDAKEAKESAGWWDLLSAGAIGAGIGAAITAAVVVFLVTSH